MYEMILSGLGSIFDKSGFSIRILYPKVPEGWKQVEQDF